MENTIYQPKRQFGQDEGNKKFLIIIDTDGNIQEVTLDFLSKERILFGKDPSRCDIVIPFECVSGVHGKFKFVQDRVLFADMDSTNGTILDIDGYRRFLKGNVIYSELHSGSILRIQPENSTPKNSVMLLYVDNNESGVWRKLPIASAAVKIGRDSNNDIILPHPGVSRTHAFIRKAGKQVVLTDNNSMNGVLVNGQRIDRPRILEEKDVIQILNSTLIYTNGMVFYKSSAKGIYIEATDVDKYIRKKEKNILKYVFGKKEKILNHVSCRIESNEFVAIIGGSGAGKTTLMNAVSGFDRKVQGNIKYNGLDLRNNFNELKNLIGYVPQEDIIYENLTLRQMLYYTARLKMPRDTTKKEIRERIGQVLCMVGLLEHADKYIRKLSGGQKKRASIAVELLADPKVFFLDEPTSGLDPGTEQKLMETLRDLSKAQGKTIVMVTHMIQNLEMCDKVIFMGKGGRICFYGTVEEAKQFFDTEDLVNIYNMISDSSVYWSQKYENYAENRNEALKNTGQDNTEKRRKPRRQGDFRQIPVIFLRYVKLICNDWKNLALLFGQPLAIAVLLFLVSNEDVFAVYEDTKSILFSLSCSAIWIGLFNSIQEICKERPVLKREYMGNLKLPFYIFAKFLVQTFLGFIQAMLMVWVFTDLVGLPERGILLENSFWEMLVTVWLTIEAAMALGFLISAFVKSGDKAMMAAPFVLIVQLLFSGILFELKGTSKCIAYVTISKWSVEGLGSIADLNHLELKIQQQMPMAEHEFQKAYEGTSIHLFENWGVLLGMVLLCAILCTVVLRTLSRDGR